MQYLSKAYLSMCFVFLGWSSVCLKPEDKKGGVDGFYGYIDYFMDGHYETLCAPHNVFFT